MLNSKDRKEYENDAPSRSRSEPGSQDERRHRGDESHHPDGKRHHQNDKDKRSN